MDEPIKSQNVNEPTSMTSSTLTPSAVQAILDNQHLGLGTVGGLIGAAIGAGLWAAITQRRDSR